MKLALVLYLWWMKLRYWLDSRRRFMAALFHPPTAPKRPPEGEEDPEGDSSLLNHPTLR